MKYGNEYFMQVSRHVWDEEYHLSNNAKLLFFWLNELEQRYCSDNKNYFYRSNEELAKDMGWSLPTLKKAKKELLQTDLISKGYVNWWMDNSHKKKSEKHVTSYTITK